MYYQVHSSADGKSEMGTEELDFLFLNDYKQGGMGEIYKLIGTLSLVGVDSCFTMSLIWLIIAINN